MLYATAIRFYGGEQHKNLKTIREIKIEQDNNQWTISGNKLEGFFEKEVIHDWLVNNKDMAIKVQSNKSSKHPDVQPEEQDGVKYVKSEPDNTDRDNLLSLPEE
ncbi:DUF3892 domain-containing protein [Leuconostoc mesenteroides]|uniref:DUF3892 domain-containing protein n=1 Tax=Leuconostoc mesenteroides TaxID=1245 RepID=UPI00112A2B24|nr:DUF3892 domain-containing protein [Leuconostoc mesenteroides]TPF00610.1 hypothetical protein DIS10_08940 [Leuconostoc mesenteroides]